AERAIAAALAMQQLTGDLTFSIGINTGEVLVTSVAGEGGATVIGDAVNVAARLEKAAGAGEVLVGPLTAELAAGRAVLRPRQPVVLKGRTQPVDVWEAVGLEGAAAATVDGLPLIGRDDELAFVLAHWRRARDDARPGVVLITGEAGVGKTRLLDEVVAAVCGEGRVARASCPAYGGLGGPRVAAQIVDDLGRSGDPEVDARVRSMAGELHPSLRAIDPNSLHHEQLWAFRRLLEIKAAETPLLVAIDDLHRSGEKMQELLGNLALRVGPMRLLLVLTGRPEPATWLSKFPSATTLRLEPLGPSNAAELAALMAEVEPEVLPEIVERSGGNPLYLRELMAMAARSGGRPGSMPPSLQAILAARLDGLDPLEKLALQHVALIGDAATPEQVEALGPPGVSGRLRALAAAGLLAHTGGGCYEVADPLLGEVAYEALPHRARAERHRRAAGVAGSDEDRARHLERAAAHSPQDLPLRAEAATAAAAVAGELLASARVADAVRLFNRAVELGFREPAGLIPFARRLTESARTDEALAMLDLLPDTPDDPTTAIEKIHIRGLAFLNSDPASSLPLFDDAAERWRDLGNEEKEGWAHANKAYAYFMLGRPSESGQELDRALAHFLATGSRQGEMAVYAAQQLARADDPRLSIWLGESLRYAIEVGDRTAQRSAVYGLGWFHFLRARWGGEADQVVADAYLAGMLPLADELGGTTDHLHVLVLQANLARLSGRLAQSLSIADAISRLGPGRNQSEAVFSAAALFSAALLRDPSASLPLPPPVDVPDPRAKLIGATVVEGLLLVGRLDEARRRLEETRAANDMNDVPAVTFGGGQALVDLLEGRLPEAVATLERVIGAADRIWARPAGAGARAMLAEAHYRLGDRARAEQLLAELPRPMPGGLAGALAQRARAAMGDEAAAADFVNRCRVLAAPGLLGDRN
ncbi:MAG: hypothetical protein QOG64_2881, partial [Acidimicrobiaceae bacterium]|nr:hypothetical protein [Acidimicrobiaceae bacterium]